MAAIAPKASPAMVQIVRDDSDLLDATRQQLLAADVVALDCEGVNLGRAGTLCIVQAAVRHGATVIFDIMGRSRDHAVVQFLRSLIEDEAKIKVLHDCKADSEALHLEFGIKLNNCHDTQAWHMAMSLDRPRNLNDALRLCGAPVNATRDSSVYRHNPRFWATRPMTSQMVDWASSDVASLFELFDHQTKNATPAQRSEAARLSEHNTVAFRDALGERVTVKQAKIGRLIGPSGANLRRMAAETGADFDIFTADRGGVPPGSPPVVLVRALTKAQLDAGVRQLHAFQ